MCLLKDIIKKPAAQLNIPELGKLCVHIHEAEPLSYLYFLLFVFSVDHFTHICHK